MNHRATKMIVIAFVTGAVTSTLSGGSRATHSMSDGSTMDGGRMPWAYKLWARGS